MKKIGQEPPAPERLYALSIKSDVSDEWINTHIMRPVAGRIVRLLYRTSVTPDQVTLAGIAAGVVAAAFYLRGTTAWVAAAGCCITLKDLLDSADGQLARAKSLYSRRGRFLDSIGDFLVNFFTFAAIGYVLYNRSGRPTSAVFAAIAFLGISLRVSYHVYYQTAYLHLRNTYATNRLSEEMRSEDLRQDSTTRLLHRVFLMLYGWQDRLMARLDRWSLHRPLRGPAARQQWYGDPVALRLSGVIGLGTELFLLTACSLAGVLELYLVLNIVGMNLVWGTALLYRRWVLARRVDTAS